MRTRAWSRLGGDEGFTLLELSVAMIIIAVVIVTLVGLQVSSLKTVGVARQRQAATALADQKIERMRALPYSTIQAGLLQSDLAGDPNVVSGRLIGPSNWNEAIITSTTQSNTELVPHVSSPPVTTTNGITYQLSTYITHPKNPDGTDSASSIDFWVTVLVKWSSAATGGHFKSVAVRTRMSYPAGCNGDVNHPYAGPCQAFLYGNAGPSAGSISITPADSSTPPVNGIPFTNASVVFSNYSSQISVEQTTSAVSKAFNSGTNVDNVVTGEDVTAAQADIDPATATTTGPNNITVPSSAASSNQISGTAGVMSLFRTGTAAGSAVQSAVAATSPGNCQDLAGTVLATNQACAASQLGRVGNNEADLDLASIAGRDLPAFALAAMQPDATASRSYSARFLAGVSGHCTNATGDGCVASGVSRSFSSFMAGGLPSGQDGDTLPSGFSGMVTGSSYADTATAETGKYSTGLAATSTAPTPTGTVRYWNGTGYTTVNLATTSNYNLGSTTATYARNGNPSVVISMSGVLKITAASTTNATPANCQPTACTAKAQGAAVVADVTYQIMSGTSQVAYFTVELNLGRIQANATYRAVASA